MQTFRILLGTIIFTMAACNTCHAAPTNLAKAPELAGADQWLNTSKPIALSSLKGHVILLDFWTYCCINCMHTLPILGRLEETFAKEPLGIIGIHSGKFSGEKVPDRIRDAMERYGIAHPVAVDSQYNIWKAYDVHAWPTVVLIDAEGRERWRASGEPSYEEVEKRIKDLLSEARTDKTLAAKPLASLRHTIAAREGLSFPGKVRGMANGQLVISDSSHHRLLIANTDGKVTQVIGQGSHGFKDGSFAEARFDDPQGAVATRDGKILFVADARNHTIRKIDLTQNKVTTLAGTGKIGQRPLTEDANPARKIGLRSPWDVALSQDEQTLYVALAGSHQIAKLDLKSQTIMRLAGSGRENIQDGIPDLAAFAQPSGLSRLGDQLFVADSETSSVRVVDLTHGTTRTLVGTGLFDFGDQTGSLTKTQLQHPLHVVATPEAVYVADTYNHKLKRLLTSQGKSELIFEKINGVTLREPGGFDRLLDGSWIVADTGHHRILHVSADFKNAAEIKLTWPASSPAMQTVSR